jgi:hypothetical protein
MQKTIVSKQSISPVSLNYLSDQQLQGFLKKVDNEDGYKLFMNTLWYVRRKMSEQLEENTLEIGSPGFECLKEMFDGLNQVVPALMNKEAANYPPFRDTPAYNHFSF